MSFFRFCCRWRGLVCGAVDVLMLAAYGCRLWMKLAADFVSIDVKFYVFVPVKDETATLE